MGTYYTMTIEVSTEIDDDQAAALRAKMQNIMVSPELVTITLTDLLELIPNAAVRPYILGSYSQKNNPELNKLSELHAKVDG